MPEDRDKTGAGPAEFGKPAAGAGPVSGPVPTLTVMEGKTDQPRYVLRAKSAAIGKSQLATIQLKGWFAPDLAAVINERDGKYYIAAPLDDKLKLNEQFANGQQQLNDGDLI